MSESEPKPSMAEELRSIAEGLGRREEQLSHLESKLDRAEAELGLDLDAIELPENTGSILDFVPEDETKAEEPVAEPAVVEEKKPEEVAPQMPVQAHAEPETNSESQAPVASVTVRDPAVIELLNQSAGLVQRHEHMRLSVENLDRKIDTLARELHAWRAEDDRRRAEAEAGQSQVFGMSVNEVKRLAGMAFIFLMIVVLWHLLT